MVEFFFETSIVLCIIYMQRFETNDFRGILNEINKTIQYEAYDSHSLYVQFCIFSNNTT